MSFWDQRPPIQELLGSVKLLLLIVAFVIFFSPVGSPYIAPCFWVLVACYMALWFLERMS